MFKSRSKTPSLSLFTALLIAAGTAAAQTPPLVTSLSPNSAPVNSSPVTLAISGQNFSASSTVSLQPNGNGIQTYVNPLTIQPTQIFVVVPATMLTTPGLIQVNVVSPSNVVSNAAAFTVTAPNLSSAVSPASAFAGASTTTLTLSGPFYSGSPTVTWTSPSGTSTVLTPALIQPQQIQVSIPAALLQTAGYAMVGVTGSDQLPFTINTATSSISPSTVLYGSGNTPVTISGGAFSAGSTVQWTRPDKHTAIFTPSLVQSAQIMATIPSAFLTTPGTAQVAILDPTGIVSTPPLPFVISSPLSISSVTPNAQVAGSGAGIITVTAASTLTNGTSVVWTAPNGQVTNLGGLISAAQIAATVPSALFTAAGIAQVALVNGTGVLSNQKPFVIEPFTISSVTPNSVAAGATSTQITFSGTNLSNAAYVVGSTPGGQVGAQFPVSTAQATQVTAIIPSGLLTTPGVYQVTLTDASGNPSNALPFSIAAPAPLTIQTTSIPGANLGYSYESLLTATGGNLIGPYTWSIVSTGAPSFLTLSPNGLLSATSVSSAGTFPLTVQVQDLSGDIAVAQLTLQVSAVVPQIPVTSVPSVPAPPPVPLVPPLSITASTSSVATSPGGAVSASFTANGGVSPYTFSATGLPAGVTLSASGAVSGSTSQPGVYSAVITVTDSQGSQTSTSLGIYVLGLTTTSLPNGTTGQAYSVSLGAIGGAHGYSFSATGLPSGLSLSGNTITGTVNTAGTYPVNVTVTSGSITAAAAIGITFKNAGPLSISNASLPNATVNAIYSQSLGASGGQPGYTWKLVSGSLPQNLTLSSSGTVAGTPIVTGTFSFGVQVTDTSGATASASATLIVNPSSLAIATQSLPSGMVGIDYPQQVLGVNGGVPPYTWTVTTGPLPTAMTLSTAGDLGGTPGASGTFPLVITVTDSKGTSASTNLTLTIRPASADLILTSGSLNFSVLTPGGAPPASQTVGVLSTVPTQKIAYSISVNPAAPWLTLSNGTSTPDSIIASINPTALTLNPGSYPTTITATCNTGACAGHTQTISVNLAVTAAPPQLLVPTSLLSFATNMAALAPLSQSIAAKNAGGGSLTFTSVSCEAAWCSAGTPPASLAGGVSGSIPITVNPGLVSPGFNRTQVDIVTPAGSASVAVTLFVAPNATMTLAPAGQEFNMPAGSAPGNPNGSLLVTVNNPNPVNWMASILGSVGLGVPNWLVLNTTSGSSTSTQPGTLSYAINAANAAMLSPGAYYARIEVVSPGISNSPEDFEVVLNVTPANNPSAPDPEPGGLLFITGVGSTPPSQTMTVYSGAPAPLTFQANAVTASGGEWLSVAPGTGSTSFSVPAATTVSVNTFGLKAGVYRGGVSYSLSATAVRTVNVTLIVTPSGPAATPSAISQLEQPRAVGCTPSVLAPAQTGPVNSFSAPAGWPTPLAILLSNDCGGAVNNGQIVATFSNGDAPIALALADPTKGLYSGTWSPHSAAPQVSINLSASAPNYAPASIQVAGSVTANPVPVLTPNGTVHSFNPLIGGVLAPGTIVAIYGEYLSSQTTQPASVPLPSVVNNTAVIIGGTQAPLYYVSPTQINAQIPFELQAGQQYQVIVSSNGALTTPDTIQLSQAAPGLAALADGTLIAQNAANGALVSQSSPATSGEYLVAYLAGLGDTTVPVLSGAASPSSPLATLATPPVLMIDGNQYPLLFAGLTPGLVGLYQIDFQVPAGLPAGNLTISVSQNGQTSNQAILPYQP